MNMLRVVPMALVLGLLGGCATTKPELPEAQYPPAAFEWYTVSRCGTAGNMDLETASLGKTYLQSALNKYTFNATQMQSEINKLTQSNTLPSREQCNDVAMKILDIKRRVDINNQNVESNQRATQELINSTRIKNTYCNRIGNSTFCNTY